MEHVLGPGHVALHPVEDAHDIAGRIHWLGFALEDEGLLQQLCVLGPDRFVLHEAEIDKVDELDCEAVAVGGRGQLGRIAVDHLKY